MKQALGELAEFWRRPRNAKYAILVASAAFIVMLCHWDVRHDAPVRRFAQTGRLKAKEWRSLARNEAGTVIGALAVWSLVGFVSSRLRREPPSVGLGRTSLCFTPGMLAVLGLATSLFGYDEDYAKTIEALALAGVATWLWVELDLWPLRVREPEQHKSRYYARVMAGAIAAYAIVFSWLSIARYQTFYAAVQDLGMYSQQLWGNLHGSWFLCSHYGLPGDTMLAEHFMPLVLLLTPFYALWQDPRTILIIQALAVPLAALPLYAIAVNLGIDRRAGLLLAGSFLLHPLVQVATLYDFHPDAFVPLFALGAFWALLSLDARSAERCGTGRKAHSSIPWRYALAYWLLVLLWLSCKEDSMFGVAVLGVYAAVFRRRWLLGLSTIAVGMVWGMAAIGWIIPHFRGEPYAHAGRYYYLVEPFGWSPDQGSFFVAFAKAALSHPMHIVGAMVDSRRILALLKLFGPVAFMSLLGPKELLLAAPAIVANLLSESRDQYEFRLHYPFAALPFIYLSAVVGVRNLAAWLGRRARRNEEARSDARRTTAIRSTQIILAALAFLASAMLCRWFGEMPLSRGFGPTKVWRRPHHLLAEKFLSAVPADASLSAQTGLAAHATHRREIYQFPDLSRDPQFVLLDAQAPTWPLSRTEYIKKVKELLDGRTYGVVAFEDGYILLRRGHSTEKNAAARKMLDRFF